MPRIPSLDDVASLDRSAWEDLCSTLCSILLQTQRVEDRFGTGNGLDAFRKNGLDVEGWQFRRLNDRFGAHQVEELKRNITTAAGRAEADFGGQLRRFVAILNVDLQAGHGKSVGELQRAHDLAEWAHREHNATFEIWGLTWVRSRLLENPTLRPELFEDVAAAIGEARNATLHAVRDLAQQVSALSVEPEIRLKLDQTLDILLKEARVHFERGQALGREEDYRRAVTSWRDALRLANGHGNARKLEGKILSVLAGALTLLGELRDAIVAGRKALEQLNEPSSNDYWWATTNLALALTEHQEFPEASALFGRALKHYEDDGNLYEITRTVQLRAELNLRWGKLAAAREDAERLASLQTSLHDTMGPSELALGLLGTIGNLHAALAEGLPQPAARVERERALVTFRRLEQGSEEAGLKRLKLLARASAGRILWYLDRLDEAEAQLREVALEDDGTGAKAVTDAIFNRGLVLAELGRLGEARAVLAQAQCRYEAAGDLASARDAIAQLKRIRE